MIREITKDLEVLTQKSSRATREDWYIAHDLLDTANANANECAGLAAIQICEPKRIIVARLKEDHGFTAMINPLILQRSRDTYTTEEGCLSLEGRRTVIRHRAISVGFETLSGKKEMRCLSGFSAQIVQHEIDHLNGILI